jgi:RNA polymerase sigma-70 factor (ECF subfamily)
MGQRRQREHRQNLPDPADTEEKHGTLSVLFVGLKNMPSDSKELLSRWQDGDEQAADELYQRYIRRLAGLVADHIATRFQQRVDAEDVLQSAYRTFFRRAGEGQFQFDDDADVWKLLVTIALNKTRQAIRRHSAGVRDVGSEVSPSADGGFSAAEMAVISRGPKPEEILMVSEMMTHLCEDLSDRHGQVLQLRLDGHSQQEVAAQLEVNERTVRRMLDQIRAQLSKETE